MRRSTASLVDLAIDCLAARDIPFSSPTIDRGDLRSCKLYRCPCRSHCSEQPQLPNCRHRANSRAKARLGGSECHGLWAGYASLGSRLSGADQFDLFIVKHLVQRHEHLPECGGSSNPSAAVRMIAAITLLSMDAEIRRIQSPSAAVGA